MKTTIAFTFALTTLASVACATPGDDTEGGGSDYSAGPASSASSSSGSTAGSSTSGGPAQPAGPNYATGMAACKAVEEQVATTQDEIDEQQKAAADCYAKLLTTTASQIDAVRAKKGGHQLAPASATAAGAFDNYRANHGAAAPAPRAFCDILVAADILDDMQGFESLLCDKYTEIRLAELVGSEADIPGGSVPITTTGAGTVDQLHAVIPAVVAQMLSNTPGDEATATNDVMLSFDGAVAASTELCSLLEDAGMQGGTPEAQPRAEACTAKAIGLLVASVKAWLNQ